MEQHKEKRKRRSVGKRKVPCGSVPWKEQYRFDIRPERMEYPRKKLMHTLNYYADVNKFLQKPLQGLHTLSRLVEARWASCNKYMAQRINASSCNEIRKLFSKVQRFQSSILHHTAGRNYLLDSEKDSLKAFIKNVHMELFDLGFTLKDFKSISAPCPLFLRHGKHIMMPMNDAILLIEILKEAKTKGKISPRSTLFLDDKILQKFDNYINIVPNLKKDALDA